VPRFVAISTLIAWTPGLFIQLAEPVARPFSFFAPVVELGAHEVNRIASGGVVTRAIDTSGHDLAVMAAGSVKTTPDTFISRVTDIVGLRKSRFVPSIARFSDPPALEDLAALTLSDHHLVDLSRCRPGNCALKLGDAEIRRMRTALMTPVSNRRSAAEQAGSVSQILPRRTPYRARP
jgi:hypothetical protein